MTDMQLVQRILTGLAARFATDDTLSAEAVETYLEARMTDLDRQARIDTLETIMQKWDAHRERVPPDDESEEVLTRVCSLLLGHQVSVDDLSSQALLENLADALNTIFNTLNQLISVINMTFTGEGSPEQTIRQVIGFRLEGEDRGSSLETYLGQISDAFLTSQHAFKQAAHIKTKQMLSALDPQKIAAEAGGGLKIGPLKKAEMFEIYTQRYSKIYKWFSSGRFTEDFLREFEKHCQSHFEKQGG